jgi:hypothetical protein
MFTGFFALLRLPGLAQICPKNSNQYQMAVSNGNDGKTKKEPLAACKFGAGRGGFLSAI